MSYRDISKKENSSSSTYFNFNPIRPKFPDDFNWAGLCLYLKFGQNQLNNAICKDVYDKGGYPISPGFILIQLCWNFQETLNLKNMDKVWNISWAMQNVVYQQRRRKKKKDIFCKFLQFLNWSSSIINWIWSLKFGISVLLNIFLE